MGVASPTQFPSHPIASARLGRAVRYSPRLWLRAAASNPNAGDGCGMLVMGYGLWVMGYGLWVVGYGLWVVGCGLLVVGC